MKEVEKIEKLHNDKDTLNEIVKDNDTFSARMQLQIIQNLELSIRDIHIVYEDKTTKPNHPFAFGITLNYISFQVR
jgi:vacuolar protein sorting-associated protein 13A/C